MHRHLIPLLYLTFFLLQVSSESFYDNPEQDPLSTGGSSLEELHKKWDFEVRVSSFSFPSIFVLKILSVVGILWDIYLCPSQACQMLDPSSSAL
jgi:hypothetical protein